MKYSNGTSVVASGTWAPLIGANAFRSNLLITYDSSDDILIGTTAQDQGAYIIIGHHFNGLIDLSAERHGSIVQQQLYFKSLAASSTKVGLLETICTCQNQPLAP